MGRRLGGKEGKEASWILIDTGYVVQRMERVGAGLPQEGGEGNVEACHVRGSFYVLNGFFWGAQGLCRILVAACVMMGIEWEEWERERDDVWTQDEEDEKGKNVGELISHSFTVALAWTKIKRISMWKPNMLLYRVSQVHMHTNIHTQSCCRGKSDVRTKRIDSCNARYALPANHPVQTLGTW